MSIRRIVATIYIMAMFFAGPAAHQYMGAPLYFGLMPFIIILFYIWWVWHGNLIGASLVVLVCLHLHMLFWPFRPASETEFFPLVKFHFQMKGIGAKNYPDQGRAQSDFFRRFEGFLFGVLSSIVATLLMPYVEVLKSLIGWP